MTVLDAGCGTGLFTAEMARMVGPEGTVHAVDLQSPCISRTLRRIDGSQAGRPSAVPSLRLCTTCRWRMSRVDLAVVIATLGEMPDPLLRPGRTEARAQDWRTACHQ